MSVSLYMPAGIRSHVPAQFQKEVNALAHVITDECTACGSCIDSCPVEAISEGDIYVIDAELCTDCGDCVETCPVECIMGPE